MLSDSPPPLDPKRHPLGLRSVEYLKEDAQNMVVWKVKAQKRGSERWNARAESRKAHLYRKSVL